VGRRVCSADIPGLINNNYNKNNPYTPGPNSGTKAEINKNTKNIQVIFVNVQSLMPKMDTLLAKARPNSYDIFFSSHDRFPDHRLFLHDHMSRVVSGEILQIKFYP
jgi:hypothetical protein